ncbi:dehydration-responsive element-binding protein 1E-like [Apium graveolens]|uniref:dehydration-responsive element-binding protein 1E-like n=1 Tax=Apium graveolens TaxID=4045 RepID=UPI003D7B48F2
MDHFLLPSTSSSSAPPQDPYDDSPHSQSSSQDPYHHTAYSQSTAEETIDHIPDEQVLLAASNPKKRGGRKKFKETRHPVYRGVRSRNPDKWVSEVREPNKNSRIWLGTFPTAEMAARAHDVAAIALRGRNACLNFADSAWRLPVPASSEAADIRKAAAEAAEGFRPKDDNAAESTSTPETSELQANQVSYVDEEALFETPQYIYNMAQAMMLSPPPQFLETGNDDTDDVIDLSLWSP